MSRMSVAGRSALSIIVGLVVVGVVMCVGVFGFGWFQRATADFRGGTGQIEQVRADPNYRIAAYDHFFDLCAQIQTTEAGITAQEQELGTDPPQARKVQINANLTAARKSRAGLINQYNADAAKADTQAHFLASGLPYKLDVDAKETTCEAD